MPAHPRISFNDSYVYTQALEEFIREDSSKACGRGHISDRKKCHKGGGSLKSPVEAEDIALLGELETRRKKQPGYSRFGYTEEEGEHPYDMGVDTSSLEALEAYENGEDLDQAIEDRKKAMRKSKPPGYFNEHWKPEDEYEASKMLGFKKSEIQRIKKASEAKYKKQAAKGNLGVALGGALALGVAAPLPFMLKSALDKDKKKREGKGAT